MVIRPLYKSLVGILLSFAIIFAAVGFAAVSGELLINGMVEYESPTGIFITNIDVISESNVKNHSVEFVKHTTTVKATMERRSSTGKVVYEVTVFNNTNYDYAYRGLYYNKNDEQNS